MHTHNADRLGGPVPTGYPVKYDPFAYEVQDDPYPIYAWMRENAPVYHNAERNFYAVSRYADVEFVLRDPVRFTNRNGISLEPSLWGPQAYKNVFFLALDPPDHAQMRSLIAKDFTPRHVGRRTERIRELTRRRLDPLLEAGDSFDFAADFAAAVPNDVVCEMLGIPEADWDTIRFDTDRLTKREMDSDERSPETLAAAFRLATYYVHLVADIRKHPSDNLTSILCQANAKGVKLSDSEIVAFIFLIVSGGNESTGKLIGSAWYHGWRLPEVQRAGLGGRFGDWLNETLRYDNSSQMTSRTSTQDTVIHDTLIPAGSRVVVLHASANRDHRVFDDPDTFDIDRDTRKMLSFGAGPHHCLGGALAKVEMEVVLEEVAKEVESYEIDAATTERVHSAHQRGFQHLPTTVRRRRRSG
jgi:cytochrome P450